MAPRACFVGLATLDVVHRVGEHVGVDEKVTARRQDVGAGGPAANAAATFAALGGAARLVTVLGSHPLAVLARADLADRGVEVADVDPDRTGPPPVSAVRVVDATGERSVSSVNDAAGESIDVLDLALGGAAVLVLDGWHRSLALAAAAAARAAGIPIVLGVGSWRPLVSELLPMADYVITSAAFPVDRVPSRTTWAQTRGADGVTWRDRDDRGVVAVPHVAVRDTLGAGDAFLGAAAYALASGATSWADVLRFAVGIASVRVQHEGMREGVRAAAASTESAGPAR